MDLALRKSMTIPEFLEGEFDGFQPIAMTGGTRAHTPIQRNLAVSLTER